MADVANTVDPLDLEDFTAAVFERVGLPSEDARTEAKVLIWANLRGVDSHGVLRIPLYIDLVDKGVMNTSPNITTLAESAATILVDADNAFGPVVTVATMQKVLDKARNVGVGWAVIRNTTHQGAMGYYVHMAADIGMAGIAIVCSPPNMAPFGARASGVHNSPIAIGVPGGNHGPLVLDMATSVAAGGKLELAKDKGLPIPKEWAIDADGNPTTDPHQSASLLPAGGPKGSGLAMMFECLASLTAGNPLIAPTLLARNNGGQAPVGMVQNSVLAAVNIASFTSVSGYRQDLDRTVEGIKSLPPVEGATEVMVPGEPEARVLAERSQNGIPLPNGTVERLREVASRLEVPMPNGL